MNLKLMQDDIFPNGQFIRKHLNWTAWILLNLASGIESTLSVKIWWEKNFHKCKLHYREFLPTLLSKIKLIF